MFVYLVTNKTNGKKYVGQHSGKDLQKYWAKHVARALGNPTDRVRAVYSAIRKYGVENFEIKPLLIVGTKEDLNYYEKALIKVLDTKTPNGYNLTDGGEGVFNPSPETRRKMSESQIGKKQSWETIQKRAEAHKGRKCSDETRARMSEAQKGNQYALGRTVSNETRLKISNGNKGNRNAVGAVRSPEYLQMLSDRSKGRVVSEETRRRMSEAASRRIVPEETKQKHRESALRLGLRPPVHSSEKQAEYGRMSGHKRYHLARNVVNPNCKFCKDNQCPSTIAS